MVDRFGMKMKSKTVLLLSSEVGVGAVGLSIARYIFAAHKIDAIALPTVLFASRPDLGSPSRVAIDATALEQQLNALRDDGRLDEIDGVMSGYFDSAAQVMVVSRFLKQLKIDQPEVTLLVDPVMGDFDSGLYVTREVAEALLADLIPIADIITPNFYEFGWLSGNKEASHTLPNKSPIDIAAELQNVEALIKRNGPCLGVGDIVVTSAATSSASGGGEMGVQAEIITALLHQGEVEFFSAAMHEPMPKGTGDVFAAELLARLVLGAPLTAATRATVHYLSRVAEKARGQTTIAPFQLFEAVLNGD